MELRIADVKLAPLKALLEDKRIREIWINGPNCVYYTMGGGQKERADIAFTTSNIMDSVNALAALSRKAMGDGASEVGTKLIVSGSYRAFRAECILPPVSIDGPVISLRRHPEFAFSLAQWVETGVLGKAQADLLRDIVLKRQNVVIVGGTGSGKTTMMNAMVAEIPLSERLLSIEEVGELKIPHPNRVRLEVYPDGGLTPARLLKSALRSKPDRILMGEVRGGEAYDFLDASMTGHPGSIGTLHASSARGGLARLENLVLEGRRQMEMKDIRSRISRTFKWVLFMAEVKTGDGFEPRLVEILSVDDELTDAGDYATRPVFRRGESQ